MRTDPAGTRDASEEGLQRACQMARSLGADDIMVLSGSAKGIDTTGRNEALDAGGCTIAVLGTGILECSRTASGSELDR